MKVAILSLIASWRHERRVVGWRGALKGTGVLVWMPDMGTATISRERSHLQTSLLFV